MGRIRTNKQYIVPGALISASYVSDLYDLVTGNIYETTALSGSLSVTGSIYGTLIGTASRSVSASIAVTASYFSGSISNAVNAQNAVSASYAATSISASYAANAIATFPYTGSAGISGSLLVNGSVFVDLLSLPTADPLLAGQIWRSGSFIMVSLG